MNLMQIELTAEQQDFVRRAAASGRVSNAEGAVQEARALWVERVGIPFVEQGRNLG